MEEIKATAAQEPAEDQEESLILKFRKPYMFEGKEYTEVDLSAMEDMTAEDLCAMGKIMTKLGIVNPVAEMTVDYAIYMAARASGKPVEVFKGLPPKEGIKLKNMVTGFLYGGDGEDYPRQKLEKPAWGFRSCCGQVWTISCTCPCRNYRT